MRLSRQQATQEGKDKHSRASSFWDRSLDMGKQKKVKYFGISKYRTFDSCCDISKCRNIDFISIFRYVESFDISTYRTLDIYRKFRYIEISDFRYIVSYDPPRLALHRLVSPYFMLRYRIESTHRTDLDHLDPNLPLSDVVQDLYGADSTQDLP